MILTIIDKSEIREKRKEYLEKFDYSFKILLKKRFEKKRNKAFLLIILITSIIYLILGTVNCFCRNPSNFTALASSHTLNCFKMLPGCFDFTFVFPARWALH